ncbi:MAG: lanthionine synthetase LanC family protein [Luteolibacter sp.]|uniref:lanthionine synthetase LanC family protein n=1 Tax=Luteolibacter sp. TaxID=1962973 RepID=UPI003265E842
MTQLPTSADSVFSFINATAEAVDCGFRWRTYDYGNRPQYHYSIFNGVGGIPIFLSAYFEVTRNPRALELARGALTWSFQNEPEEGSFQRGLQMGKFGVAYSALCVSRASVRDEFPEFTEDLANHVLSEAPGPITDLISGEASNGWLLLQLWQKKPEAKYLEGAIRCGRWLENQLVTDELGTHCLVDPIQKSFGTKPYSGLSHGISGVAHFFACLYRATSDAHWKGLAIALLETLVRHAQPARGGINWSPILGMNELTRCQYSHGAAGIGLVFAKAAGLLDQPDYLSIALQAGEATYQYGDYRENPTLCTGLAGGGELLVELYRITMEEIWLERAREFAEKALAYRSIIDGQTFWPTDAVDCFSADFTYGASGIGYFFLRVMNPLQFEPPLM